MAVSISTRGRRSAGFAAFSFLMMDRRLTFRSCCLSTSRASFRTSRCNSSSTGPQGCCKVRRDRPVEAAFFCDRRPVEAVAALRRRRVLTDQVKEIAAYLQQSQGWDAGSKPDPAVVGCHPTQDIFVHGGAKTGDRKREADGGASRISRQAFSCQRCSSPTCSTRSRTFPPNIFCSVRSRMTGSTPPCMGTCR